LNMFNYLGSRTVQRAVLFALLAVWMVSFFLPALDNPPMVGWKAARASMAILFVTAFARTKGWFADPGAIVVVLHGLLWIANALMLASPWMLARGRRRQGQVGIALLAVWDAMIFAAPWVTSATGEPAPERFGYFVWQASILGMTAFLWLVRQQAKKPAAEPLQDGDVSRVTI
jgi:hypothetical protein